MNGQDEGIDDAGPVELGDEMLDLVSAAAGTCIDPNGRPDA